MGQITTASNAAEHRNTPRELAATGCNRALTAFDYDANAFHMLYCHIAAFGVCRLGLDSYYTPATALGT